MTVTHIAPLVITVGVSCSGKTTFARRITSDGTFFWIERDALMPMFSPNGDYSTAIGDLVKAEQLRRWTENALACVPVMISNTHLKMTDLTGWLEQAQAHDYELVIVMKNEPLDILLQRNACRQVGHVPDEVIRLQTEQFCALLSMEFSDKLKEAIEKGNRIADASSGAEVMRRLGYKATWSKST